MIEKRAFKKTFGAALEPFGYRRKGQTWHKSAADVISAIDLQSSNFDEFYYVNVGFSLKSLTGDELLPTNRCHICLRAERLLPDCRDTVIDLFRLDFGDLDYREHTLELGRFVSERLAPRCNSLLSLEELCAEHANGGFRGAAVLREAVPALTAGTWAQQ